MTESTPQKRVRINVSRTSKGLYSFEATVELSANIPYTIRDNNVLWQHGEGTWQEDLTLKESDYLIAKLNERYPLEPETK